MDQIVVFHVGEQAVQARLGVAERMAVHGPQVIRDYMPEQHRQFFPLLPMLPVAVRDEAGWPAATLLTGRPGFVSSPDPRTLHIAALPDPIDPAASGFAETRPIGILGIDLSTRRRNRVNGRIAAMDADGVTVSVVQSFGNCAQYIQRREPDAAAVGLGRTQMLTALDTAARNLITASDTLFVASGAGDAGLDMSHRGGRPGFVRIDGDVLTVPDFAGNRFFNTLGNFLVEPRAALLFIDFANGDLLQLQGQVEIDWDHDGGFAGAQRLWRLHVRHGWRRSAAVPLHWTFQDYAPTTTRTGRWVA